MKRLITILLLFISLQAISQTTFNDAMAWLSFSISQKIEKKNSLRLINRFRVGENFSQLNSWYSDLGFQYKINNQWSISADYVYTPSRLGNREFGLFHQYYTSINYKEKIIKKTYFSNRVIIQRSSGGTIFETGNPLKNSTEFREKLGFNRKLNKHYIAFVSDEILFPLSSYNLPFEIKRNRLYAGVSRDLKNKFDLDTYFVLQSSYHSAKQNSRFYIVGIDLNYSLKKIKRKKKEKEENDGDLDQK